MEIMISYNDKKKSLLISNKEQMERDNKKEAVRVRERKRIVIFVDIYYIILYYLFFKDIRTKSIVFISINILKGWTTLIQCN